MLWSPWLSIFVPGVCWLPGGSPPQGAGGLFQGLWEKEESPSSELWLHAGEKAHFGGIQYTQIMTQSTCPCRLRLFSAEFHMWGSGWKITFLDPSPGTWQTSPSESDLNRNEIYLGWSFRKQGSRPIPGLKALKYRAEEWLALGGTRTEKGTAGWRGSR